jgi:mono/diheme cytochrome c family protein
MPTHQEERFPLPTPWRLARELRLRRPPWWMVLVLVVVVVATWVPLALIARARGTTSRLPRVHFFLDMDQQAKYGTQSANPLFADGRAMRQPVVGTIARGSRAEEPSFRTGYTKEESSGAIQFLAGIPSQLVVDDSLLLRGHQRYQIFCAVCHGESGTGDGPVNQRAIELKESKWVPATNLMTKEIRDRPDGQIYQAIGDGVRNMPSYGSQIDPRDRWAIVAHLRQLQASSPVAPTPAAVAAANPPSTASAEQDD